MSATRFIQIAEAAFIADLTYRQLNRVVDERLVPDGLFEQRDSGRFFTRLGAAFAKFYFATEDLLLAGARRQVLEELGARVARLPTKEQVLSLTLLNAINWNVEVSFVQNDVLPFIREAFNHATEVDKAEELVSNDSEIMGGAPVFAGTRVPIDTVLSSLATGIHLERLKSSYPFLTKTHIKFASVYEEVYPRRERPRRIAEVNPELTRRVRHVTKRTTSE